MSESAVPFTDFVVKLLVIDHLIEEEGLEPPYDNGHDWLEGERGIDFQGAEGLLYGDLYAKRIPEAEKWARELEITEDQLATVTDLTWDGGNGIFLLLAPSWDGEDDLYDVETWVDVTPERFPNLESLTYAGELEDSVREALEEAGVEVEEF
ncbi:DUF6892 domain-containing protein [Nocardioides sp. GXZ039]|uniref:DUF6892 domain-containing protein n=1 Tax=Nocardioides sp. GXZ039 TaxID=3136018 RepID=UPI0030F3CA99